MIVAFTLFILSFIGMAGMIAIQIHKMNTGKTFVLFRYGEKFDLYLRQKFHLFRMWVSFINLRTAALLFHFILDRIEGVFVKMKERSHKKIHILLEKAKAAERKMKISQEK
jgi:hypothetical protein